MRHITRTKIGNRNTYKITSEKVANFFSPCESKRFGRVIGDIEGLTLSQARHILKLLKVCGAFGYSRNPGGCERCELEGFEPLEILKLVEAFRERTKNMGSNSTAAAFLYMFHKEPKRKETRNGKHYGTSKKATAFESFKGWPKIWEEFARVEGMTEMEKAKEFGEAHEVKKLAKKYEARNKKREANKKKKREEYATHKNPGGSFFF